MNSILAAAAVLALASWAGPKNPKPDWVDGAGMEFPREQFLTGVGSADDRASAESRARAEISRVFSTEVSAQSSLSETEVNDSQGGKSQGSFSQQVSQSVQTASKKVLEDVSIAETWKDEAAMKHYALAILERAKGVTVLKDKMGEIDAQIAQWKKSLDEASERMPKVKAAMKLLALLKARSSLNSDLRVVDPSGQGLKSPIDDGAARTQAAKALSELDLIVDVRGEGGKSIATGIVKGLGTFGLEAKIGSGQCDIAVEGTVETEPLELDEKRLKRARSTATVTLKDSKTDKVFLRIEEMERADSINFSEAVRRSLVKLSSKVSKKISEGIAEYFENQ
jgi:hypothetical protein